MKESMRLLLLYFAALLASCATATVHQYCAAFEGPLWGFTPVFRVSSPKYDIHALVLHIRDLDDSYRNLVDLDKWISVDGVYPLMNSQVNETVRLSEGKLEVSAVAEKNKNLEFPVIDEYAAPGADISYNISSAGVYCAIVQWSPSEEDHQQETLALVAMTEHSYGETPLTHNILTVLTLAILMMVLYGRVIVPRLFKRTYDRGEFGNWKLTLMFLVGGRLYFGWLELTFTWAVGAFSGNPHIRPSLLFFGSWLLLDKALTLGLTWMFYMSMKGAVHSYWDSRDGLGKTTIMIFSVIFGVATPFYTHGVVPALFTSGITFSFCVDVSAALTAMAFSCAWIDTPSMGFTGSAIGETDEDRSAIKKCLLIMFIFFAVVSTVAISLISFSRAGENRPLSGTGDHPLSFGFVQDVRLSYNHIIMICYIIQHVIGYFMQLTGIATSWIS